ncbi:MAG: riboflavin biosynthesis protein RibF [Lactobacillales bacterium]|nr:riboflavin biosynthesis protein RibF [Lactobacillales bacterium]
MKEIHLHHPYSVEDIPNEDVVLILGYFDGIHKGHQKVIEQGRKIATKQGLKLALMSFDKQPLIVFQKFFPEMQTTLCSAEKKREKIEKLGVDFYYLVDFTSHFASLSPQAFVDQYIVSLRAKVVVAGFDYTYGPQEYADMEHLPQYARERFVTETVPAFLDSGEKISSTLIRTCLNQGNIKKANYLLGFTYETSGMVVRGAGRGHQLGSPTANIEFERGVFLPKVGVYVNEVELLGKRYRAMGSIGHNKTFGEGQRLTVEINIFDFDKQIYGEYVKIHWKSFLRNQKRFSSAKELIVQLKKDQQMAYMITTNA